MSAGHHGSAHLYIEGASPLHHLAPEAKVAGAMGFMLSVVLIPRGTWMPVALATVLVAVVVLICRLPARMLAARLAIEVPFLGFALLMPFFGTGTRSEVFGLSVYSDGIEAGATLLAKGTLGVIVAVTLAATTTVSDILRGLRRLRVPAALVLVIQLMLRYAEVLLAEARRMHVARQARGYQPRWLWQARGFAAGLGTLFVRAFERGERVHRAMASRGFTGTMPSDDIVVAAPADWGVCLLPAAAVVAAMVLV